MCDERFPETQEQASELIERFRRETGHPEPGLQDARPPPPGYITSEE
jgi:hypothetical protein